MYVAEATKGAVIVFVGSVLVCMRMALVRERAMVYGGGFDAEAFGGGFESSQMGYGHDALLDIDAAALFGGYEAAASAGCALVQDGAAGGRARARRLGAGVRPRRSGGGGRVRRVDRSHGPELRRRRRGGAVPVDDGRRLRRGHRLLQPDGESHRRRRRRGWAAVRAVVPEHVGRRRLPERAAPAPAPRGSQKRAHAESSQAMSPSKKQCGAGRKAGKAKSVPTTPTKDPQSLAAKVIKLLLNSAPKSYCYSDQSMYRTELELFLPAAESAREDQRAAADPAGARAQRHQGRPRHHAREGHQLRQVPPASSQGTHTSLAMCTRLRG